MSQPIKINKQTIKIHVLRNTSSSKGNQTIKFSKLIKHNMRKMFLEKSCTNVVEKLFPGPFLKKQKTNLLIA